MSQRKSNLAAAAFAVACLAFLRFKVLPSDNISSPPPEKRKHIAG